ncbi:reverse transcriptase domain-containing protein [Tanacetum coccineum]|uniref:Reverse transcriptase domain-containing protein n=1 Tax=Tanacetum coccineum TaxID=301880 RepID=A0ABQ5AIE9_9ASTR
MLTGPEKTGRADKWAIELGEHDIVFLRRNEKETPADFLVKIPFEDNEKKEKPKEVPDSNSKWRLYTDGASNLDGSGAGLMLIDPEGLWIAQEMEIAKVAIFLDSQLLVNQIKGTFAAKQTAIKDYLQKVKTALRGFEEYTVEHATHEPSLIKRIKESDLSPPKTSNMRKTNQVPKGNLLLKVAEYIGPQLKATLEPSLIKNIKESDLSTPKTLNIRKTNQGPKGNLLLKVAEYICPQLKATHEPSLIEHIKESDLSPPKTSNMRKTIQVPKGSLP